MKKFYILLVLVVLAVSGAFYVKYQENEKQRQEYEKEAEEYNKRLEEIRFERPSPL